MKRGVTELGLFLGIVFLMLAPAYAQEGKGLSPGWLSLDSSVGLLDKKIESAKSTLEKALGIKISGFLDTSYTWSSNHPGGPEEDISLRVFDIDHNDVVFNHFNLTLERPEPEKGWGLGGKLVADFGRTAELLREATFYGVSKLKGAGNGGEPSAELREAFLTTTLPLGAGLQVKGGLFVTTLGTEIIPNPGAYNDNISRSYLFGFAIPFRHLGMLFTYPLHKTVSVSAGPVTGWDNPHDNNRQPSFLGGIAITPNEKASLASNVIIGPERNDNTTDKRLAWSNVLTIKPADPLALALEYTYGHEERATASRRDATWQGFGAIASYSWTDRFSTALRGEIFRDSDGARMLGGFLGVPKDLTVGEITLTAAYKFTKMLLGRIEVRQDWADEAAFQKGSTRSDKNQTTLALQAIYTF